MQETGCIGANGPPIPGPGFRASDTLHTYCRRTTFLFFPGNGYMLYFHTARTVYKEGSLIVIFAAITADGTLFG